MTPQDRLAAALHKSLVGCGNECFDGEGRRDHSKFSPITAKRLLNVDPTIAADMTVGEQIRLHGYTLTNQQAADMELGRLLRETFDTGLVHTLDREGAGYAIDGGNGWHGFYKQPEDALRAALTEPDR